MNAQKENFLAGAKKKGVISGAKASKIFDQIAKFAEYGFNKSHSAAYAALAFQTAYLKAHFPHHFMAALLTSEAERGATAQIVKYIGECRILGLEVLPPDINASDFNFTVSENAVRFGLAAVKNVGETAARALIAVRKERSGFRTLFDVVRDADGRVVNRKVLESLIKAGAFDVFGMPRSQCFHLIEALIQSNHEIQRSRLSSQSLLFGGTELEPPDIPAEVRSMPEWDDLLKLSYEKDALGFYISGHPLSQYQRVLPRLTSHAVADLDDERDASAEVRLAGVIADFRLTKTRKEERMAVFQLEDMTGRIEIVAFPETYKRSYDHLREGVMVWLKGKFQSEGENRKILLSLLLPLDEAAQKLAKRFVIRLAASVFEDAFLEEMRQVLEKSPGECPVVFELETLSAFKVIAQSPEMKGVAPTDALTLALEKILGPDSVLVEY
jgi:DNA polymerase-3 subunit alpha